MLKPIFGAIAMTLLASQAAAQIEVSFRDGAPKDRFVIQNSGACETAPMTLAIDMERSVGKVIFDVTSAGAGVEVFQPLEIVEGAQHLSAIPQVRDGQNQLAFDLKALPSGARIAFTIDVDDTIGQREITVSGSELQGSALLVTDAGFEAAPAVFDANARATLKTPDCLS